MSQITSRAVISHTQSGKSVTATAIWDTGAMVSLINNNIVNDLQLKKIDAVSVRHVGGTEVLPKYAAAVELQGGMIINRLPLLAFPGGKNFGMIIGMDIIKLGRFCIENKNGNTVFSFRY